MKVVYFDVGGTLLAPDPSLAEIYRRVLAPLGIECEVPEFRWAAIETWAEFDAMVGRGRNRYAHFPGGERAYWRAYVGRVLDRVSAGGVASRRSNTHAAPRDAQSNQSRAQANQSDARTSQPPDLQPSGPRDAQSSQSDARVRGPSEAQADEATAALHAAFSEPSTWAVFPEVRATLASLRAKGLRLAVISNWDSRLRPLLGKLGLAEEFEEIVVSSEVGAEKPAPAIFEAALGLMGASPGEALHVGDDLVSDYEGAAAMGMEAALLVRRGDAPAHARSVTSLDGLLPILSDGA